MYKLVYSPSVNSLKTPRILKTALSPRQNKRKNRPSSSINKVYNKTNNKIYKSKRLSLPSAKSCRPTLDLKSPILLTIETKRSPIRARDNFGIIIQY